MNVLFALLFATPTLLLPKDGAVVPTHTAVQKEYLELSTRAMRVEKFTDHDYRKRLAPKHGWYPLPTELTWRADGECEVRVARKSDGRLVFSGKSSDGKTEIDNLEIACDYVWTVRDASGEASACFRTEDEAPRLLRVPQIENLRDLGGRIGLDGRRVKQNMVFRNIGLNDNASRKPKDKDEIAKADPTGALIAAGDQILEYREGLKKLRHDKTGMVFPKCTPPAEWRYASVAKKLDFMDAAMIAVTGKLPEGDRTVKANAEGIADFAGSGCDDWVAMTGVMTAESDGYAYLGASADWYWSLEVNGQLVRCLLAGNDAESFSPEHKILVPVRKGENRLRVLLGRGDAGHIFLLREMTAGNRDKVLEHELAKLKDLPVKIVGESKEQVPGKSHIGDDNRDYLLNTLGIRSDIDLRSDGECYGMTGSPLGESVTWYHISFSAYAGMQTRRGREAFAKVFRVFLDEKNYPIDFHCIAGQDRTGSVAFALNALLGVEEEQLYLDWEATAFWNSSVLFSHQALFDKLIEGFEKNYPEGKTVNEKVELYVKSLGFTDADLAHFREIMLEK